MKPHRETDMTLGPILEWLPSETAPSTRPAWVVSGDFILPDGNRIYIPDQRTARAGWGRIGSTHIVDPVARPLPAAMAVTWFSLSEQQSYSAQVELPFDRLVAMFTTPLNNPLDDTDAAPDRLIVGFAPGGDVMVWAAGITGTVEVGLWQAEPTRLSMDEIIGEGDITPEALAEMLLKESLTDDEREALARAGPQPGLWRARAQRFIWAPEIVAATGRAFRLEALNGEIEWLPAAPAPAPRAAPERMRLYWHSTIGALVAELVFDPTESLTAFQKFTQDLPDRPLRLLLEPADADGGVEAVLTDGTLAYRFEGLSVAVYRA
ncbi:MAG: DUF2931 family protein [Nannocystis sp.]|nr:DUF2931 family protein [Nannocystis sp.]MBA3548558.1 DUF2931 family protein [Nannocystis sp.]